LDNLRQLLGVEIAALVALLLVSSFAALLLHLSEQSFIANAPGQFQAWFAGLMLVGTPVALLYGGPAYFMLRKHSMARWGPVLAIGLLPTFPAFAMSPPAGALTLVCGLGVACLTHVMCRNRV
jgi:hypothetical protein